MWWVITHERQDLCYTYSEIFSPLNPGLTKCVVVGGVVFLGVVAVVICGARWRCRRRRRSFPLAFHFYSCSGIADRLPLFCLLLRTVDFIPLKLSFLKSLFFEKRKRHFRASFIFESIITALSASVYTKYTHRMIQLDDCLQ